MRSQTNGTPLNNNGLNQDQAQKCVGPDLGPNCLLNILFISQKHKRVKGWSGTMHMTKLLAIVQCTETDLI